MRPTRASGSRTSVLPESAKPEERDVVREEPDTQFLIDEMQGYAKYTDELKAKVVGLMAGIRAFSATLSKA